MAQTLRPANRLIHETSPYLLEHAHNPVDWYPWGEEALSRARKEDKPILLSIGYSACHWCHVMEKECFEDEKIARIMNERFVNIKVDREERPDLDELYMNAAQMMTGGGGWPLNIFLTPQLIPFHAGTYFPPEDRGGIPAFPKVLLIVSDYYRDRRGEVEKINAQIENALRQLTSITPFQEVLEPGVLEKAYGAFEQQFDGVHGGFGQAPKFPNSLTLSFLLRYWKQSGERRALAMVETTLDRMAKGGIYDQLGGGFHRYSVDERWLIPHFEKMLYDNALLCRIYFEAYQATQRERYRQVGEEILSYVLREMTSPQGGFFSSQDADTEGREGKFYVWNRNQIRALLGRERETPFCAYYGITTQGNFEGEWSVLHVASSLENVSKRYGIPLPELKALLQEGRERLFLEREKRVKPHRDEKVLVSWNGLMISALTDGYRITGQNEYLEAARKAADFVLHRMNGNGQLLRTFFGGKSRIKAYAEDYAFFIQALIDLYEATFDLDWLRRADELNREMIRQFWDEDQGGFFFTGTEHERLIARSKHPYDNVTPSSNSVALFNLLRLGFLTGEESLSKKAEQTLRLFYGLMSQHPPGFAHMLSAFSFFLDPEEIGLIGPKNDPKTEVFIRAIRQAYLPTSIVSLWDPKESTEERWFPFLKQRGAIEVPTAFVCKKFTCLPPITEEEELKKVVSR